MTSTSLFLILMACHTVAQYANHIHVWGEAPHESRRVWNKPLHCKVPDPLLREGVARETISSPIKVLPEYSVKGPSLALPTLYPKSRQCRPFTLYLKTTCLDDNEAYDYITWIFDQLTVLHLMALTVRGSRDGETQ